jgi:hypothetical protein
MLQEGEYFQAEHDGWASPDSITAEVLGWKLQDVLDKKPHTSRRHGWTPDSTLVRTVHMTILLFIEQSDVPYADKSPKYPEVGKWYWFNDAPAFILNHSYLPLIEILIPNSDFFPLLGKHAAPEPSIYQLQWKKLRVPPDEIQKIRLDKAELEY